MLRYVEQLVEDIRIIAQKQNRLKDIRYLNSLMETDTFDFDELNFLNSNEKRTLGEITSLHTENLPSTDKLTNNQKALLSVELEIMLNQYNFSLEFPNKYPSHLRYSYIRDLWKEKHTYSSNGCVHIEFCEYNKRDCPFPGYCRLCDEYEEEIRKQEELNTNLLIEGSNNEDII